MPEASDGGETTIRDMVNSGPSIRAPLSRLVLSMRARGIRPDVAHDVLAGVTLPADEIGTVGDPVAHLQRPAVELDPFRRLWGDLGDDPDVLVPLDDGEWRVGLGGCPGVLLGLPGVGVLVGAADSRHLD